VQTAEPNAQTLKRLDDSLGGSWWRQHFAEGGGERAVAAVVDGFAAKLRGDTGLLIVPVPVRRAPHHKPIYHLIFGTRSQHGLWVFGDALARASEAWWDTLAAVEGDADPYTLFSATATIRPKLEVTEARAVPVIAGHLTILLEEHPTFRTVDHTLAVFGEFYGQVRDLVVRQAVAALHAQGGTSSDGRRKRPRDIVVAR
jgi:hypothetical protein